MKLLCEFRTGMRKKGVPSGEKGIFEITNKSYGAVQQLIVLNILDMA